METTFEIEEDCDAANLFTATLEYLSPIGDGGSGLDFTENRAFWASDRATTFKNTMAYSGKFVVLVCNAIALPWDHTVNAVLSEAHFIRVDENNLMGLPNRLIFQKPYLTATPRLLASGLPALIMI